MDPNIEMFKSFSDIEEFNKYKNNTEIKIINDTS